MSLGLDKDKTSSRAICTIVTKSYLAYARTLSKSISKHNPDILLYVLLADKVDGFFDPSLEPFKLICLEDLPDQQVIEKMCFYYTPFELCCALRGFLHQYMLEQSDVQNWLFLDSDVMVFSSLDEIFSQLKEASILLTPHCNTPVEKEFIYPHEVNIVSSGLYNAGFLGLNRTEETKKFIYWFKERLELYSLNDLYKGQFVDQIWLNLAPIFFDNVKFCSSLGANIGHWNLFERKLANKDGMLTVNSEALLFVHFSGWDINNPQKISKYAPMYDEQNTPDLWACLGKTYRESLLNNEYFRTKEFPYAFGYFIDGKAIIPSIRRAYYDEVSQRRDLEGSPFSMSKHFYSQIETSNKRSLLRRFAKKLLKLAS